MRPEDDREGFGVSLRGKLASVRSCGLVGVHDFVVIEGRLLKRYGHGHLGGDIGTLVVDSIANCMPTEGSERPGIKGTVLGCDLCSSFGIL